MCLKIVEECTDISQYFTSCINYWGFDAGEYCEGDGECGTRQTLNNCGGGDFYQKVDCAFGPPPPSAPPSPPAAPNPCAPQTFYASRAIGTTEAAAFRRAEDATGPPSLAVGTCMNQLDVSQRGWSPLASPKVQELILVYEPPVYAETIHIWEHWEPENRPPGFVTSVSISSDPYPDDPNLNNNDFCGIFSSFGTPTSAKSGTCAEGSSCAFGTDCSDCSNCPTIYTGQQWTEVWAGHDATECGSELTVSVPSLGTLTRQIKIVINVTATGDSAYSNEVIDAVGVTGSHCLDPPSLPPAPPPPPPASPPLPPPPKTPPLPPPKPPLSPGQSVAVEVTATFVLSETIESFNADKRADFIRRLAAEVEVPEGDITLVIEAASIYVYAIIRPATPDAAQAVDTFLARDYRDVGTRLHVEVLQPLSVERAVLVKDASPPSAPPAGSVQIVGDGSGGVSAGVLVAIVVALLVIFAGIMLLAYKKIKKARESPSVVLASPVPVQMQVPTSAASANVELNPVAAATAAPPEYQPPATPTIVQPSAEFAGSSGEPPPKANVVTGRAMPGLIEVREVFKTQLKIKGANTTEVVDAACVALGIPVAGTLVEKAERCWEQLYPSSGSTAAEFVPVDLGDSKSDVGRV